MGEFVKARWLRLWRWPIVRAMRLKSSIWVAAYLRRCQTEGIFGAVRRRGAEEAGAVVVKVAAPHGNALLFRAAPQTGHDDRPPGQPTFLPPTPGARPGTTVGERPGPGNSLHAH